MAHVVEYGVREARARSSGGGHRRRPAAPVCDIDDAVCTSAHMNHTSRVHMQRMDDAQMSVNGAGVCGNIHSLPAA